MSVVRRLSLRPSHRARGVSADPLGFHPLSDEPGATGRSGPQTFDIFLFKDFVRLVSRSTAPLRRLFMLFIPKGLDGVTLFGVPFFNPESTRPLSLANTITKIVSSNINSRLKGAVDRELGGNL